MCVNSYSPDTPLGRQALASYNAAFTEQTWLNKIKQAETYLTFALIYGFDILTPTIADACTFVQYLVNSLQSPTSRKNYLSGARWWILERGGDPTALTSREAKAVERGAIRLSPHVTTPAPPLHPTDLVKVAQALDNIQDGYIYKAALTMGYFGFLRTSNLLAPRAALWGGTHTLKRHDVIIHNTGLLLIIRSSKTIRLGTTPPTISLPTIPGSPVCPTAAWKAYVTRVPAHPASNAFIMTDGTHLTNNRLITVLRATLLALGSPHALTTTSHSLRRGGSQAAQLAGAAHQDIQAHGTWKAKGSLKTYLAQQSSERVAHSMAHLFAP